MLSKDVIARKGEEHADNYLLKNNYSILHCNWRHSRYEIEIIATRNDVLHIIEVKSLCRDDVTYPKKQITKKIIQSMKKVASAFLSQHPLYSHVQFDVLSVIAKKHSEPECL